MDGTSMASPHAAGGMAIVQQALKARDNSMTGAQRKHMTDTLLMSTAHVIYDDNGVPYSPRKQGAGLMSINDAVNTRCYLSVEGMERPKLELKDDHRPQHRQRHPVLRRDPPGADRYHRGLCQRQRAGVLHHQRKLPAAPPHLHHQLRE